MGYTRWSDADYQTYSDTTNYRAATSVSAVFSNTAAPPSDFVVQNIQVRESRDSELNPRSTPIILGLDVTGSMGKYAAQIAQEHLPNLMSHIINNSVVSDPHILVMGIGDPRAYDSYPAQASQFETDLRIIEQTRELFMEGRGGGNDHEGYDQAWYFAKYCTATDAKECGRKGVIFTFGDEPPASIPLTETEWKKVFGNKEYPKFSSMQELYAEVAKDWQIFHVVIEEGNYFYSGKSSVINGWKRIMPPSRILYCKNSHDITKICVTALEVLALRGDEPLPSKIFEDDALRHAFSGLLASHLTPPRQPE